MRMHGIVWLAKLDYRDWLQNVLYRDLDQRVREGTCTCAQRAH